MEWVKIVKPYFLSVSHTAVYLEKPCLLEAMGQALGPARDVCEVYGKHFDINQTLGILCGTVKPSQTAIGRNLAQSLNIKRKAVFRLLNLSRTPEANLH